MLKLGRTLKDAGICEAPANNLIKVLVAGIVGGVAQVIEAEPSGMADFSPVPDNFIGAGLYAPGAAEYAYLASAVAMQFEADDEQRLKAVMASVATWQGARERLGIGGTIAYWRITSQGIERF